MAINNEALNLCIPDPDRTGEGSAFLLEGEDLSLCSRKHKNVIDVLRPII